MLYRVNKPLTKGSQILKKGFYSDFEWLSKEGKEILLRDNVISELQTPPLESLPGWKTRSKRLETFNIKTCTDFLELSDSELSNLTKWRSDIIKKYKKEIEQFIFVEEKVEKSR